MTPKTCMTACGCLLLTCLSPASFLGFANEVSLPGRVTAVTVYRDQARVMREIDIPASDQPQKIRIPGLPPQLIEQSSFTESNEGAQVVSLQVFLQSRKQGKDADEAARAALQELREAERAAEHQLPVIEQDMLTLERLVRFSADKVQQNLDRATLDVQSVTALADFTMERRRKLAQELYKQQSQIESLKRQIAKKLEEPQNASVAEPHYEAIMTVQSKSGGTVRLFYDVSEVYWNPRYKIKGKQDAAPEVTIQMEAVIVQRSGESWNDVSLTLATSTPQTQAAGPSLIPLRISTAPLNVQTGTTGALGQFETAAQSHLLRDEQNARNLQLNLRAGERQISEITTTAEVQRTVASDSNSNTFDETYTIEKNVSLDSHTQPQSVTILSTNLEGKLDHLVTPLLSSFAFREATMVNASGKSLIAGPADVYLDSKFVGRVDLPPTAEGQTLTVGFGSDRQVRTRRELLSRHEVITGGNRKSDLQYRLVISNYHRQPIEVRLLDRIPLASKDNTINITLSSEELKRLSPDPLYQRIQKPTGILRWDLTVPASRFGSSAYDYEYGYSVEHDREQTLVGDDLVQRMQDDLQFDSINGGMGGMGGSMGGF